MISTTTTRLPAHGNYQCYASEIYICITSEDAHFPFLNAQNLKVRCTRNLQLEDMLMFLIKRLLYVTLSIVIRLNSFFVFSTPPFTSTECRTTSESESNSVSFSMGSLWTGHHSTKKAKQIKISELDGVRTLPIFLYTIENDTFHANETFYFIVHLQISKKTGLCITRLSTLHKQRG